MAFNIPFHRHAGFAKLQKLLTNSASRFIEIAGVPYVLQESLLLEIYRETKAALIYATLDNSEIRHYAESIELVNFREIAPRQLINFISNNNFSRVGRVEDVGEYTLKGDVLSIWPPGYKHPLKISYFGDDFETAFGYDEIYGKKFADIGAMIIGDLRHFDSKESMNALQIIHPEQIKDLKFLIFGGDLLESTNHSVTFDFGYAQLYFQRFDLLERDLERKLAAGYEIHIFTGSAESLPKIAKKHIKQAELELSAGFESPSLKYLVLTDRELFGTVFISKEINKLSSSQARKLLASLEGEIEIGDYVVHDDFGIGIYRGIKQEEFETEVRIDFGRYLKKKVIEDYLLIDYAEGDQLLIPLSQINQITKYINTDENEPKITRLGKQEWARIKSRVKESVEILARELTSHYAKRQLAKTEPVEIDVHSAYERFLSEFPYQATPDQLRTEAEIFKDLQKSTPMNRLIVGDVGFGKTEVAMRATFIVAETGKQVAVLCPTTVLAAQHAQVFSERFKSSGFKVGVLSRFSHNENAATLEKLERGELDIIIGTHRLLSHDVKFKKLGLLIIDEEQKFGVKQKEKIKALEYTTHVLMMSATPIPRSLSMALSAIQEISIIQTPPEGRRAINTYVSKTDMAKIAAAIQFETTRKGQVYYVHNRVQSIHSLYVKLKKLLPGVRFVVGHGQMSPEQLEKVITDFYAHKYDVLICTTIIENGIDMPNVNTIIIDHAQNFGLGQLYQLRGRVGRGERQAYAYMFYEGEDLERKRESVEISVHNHETGEEEIVKVKPRASKYKDRLKAILETQEVGSGFKLASRDLEIRGAGNLLGKEQHGNISHIGYGLYMQLLAEEIEKLKNSKN